MSNSLLFEGRDLEEVLGEARLCFGPDVEIEAAALSARCVSAAEPPAASESPPGSSRR